MKRARGYHIWQGGLSQGGMNREFWQKQIIFENAIMRPTLYSNSQKKKIETKRSFLSMSHYHVLDLMSGTLNIS